MKTRLTELFGLKHPIIQAPMAGVSTPAMAAAAANAGALGSVALGALDAEAARRLLLETMAQTDGPIAANVFVHPRPLSDPDQASRFLTEIAPAFAGTGVEPPERLDEIYLSFNDDDEMLKMLLEVRPAALSLHFGTADEARMSALKNAGIRVLATATTVAEAELLVASGVDGLVVQGYDAGGHSGAFLGAPDEQAAGLQGLAARVRAVADSVAIPVVAAGGLMSGADIHAMLAVGADGAQLGTAFVPSPESLAQASYRQALTGNGQTRLTANISGRPARGLDNGLMRWAQTLQAPAPDYPLTYDAIKQLVAARAEPDFSVMWAGAGAARVRALGTAELVELLAEELAAAEHAAT